jgi:hypothetical protein
MIEITCTMLHLTYYHTDTYELFSDNPYDLILGENFFINSEIT